MAATIILALNGLNVSIRRLPRWSLQLADLTMMQEPVDDADHAFRLVFEVRVVGRRS